MKFDEQEQIVLLSRNKYVVICLFTGALQFNVLYPDPIQVGKVKTIIILLMDFVG